MKKLFLISEEEKQRILEMHSAKKVMTEQVLQPTSNLVKPGLKINLYTDEANMEAPVRYTIVKIDEHTLGVINITVKTEEHGGGKDTKTLSFSCADNGLVSSEKSVDAEGNEVTPKFYSKSFVPALRAQFCQKNKAGQWVPKAAFASAGMPTDSGLA